MNHLTCVWKSLSQSWPNFVFHNFSSKLAFSHLKVDKEHQKLVAKGSQLIEVPHIDRHGQLKSIFKNHKVRGQNHLLRFKFHSFYSDVHPNKHIKCTRFTQAFLKLVQNERDNSISPVRWVDLSKVCKCMFRSVYNVITHYIW
jgi:hypothetical protein